MSNQFPNYQGGQIPPQPRLSDPFPPKPPKKPMSREARIGWTILGGLVILLFGVGIGAGAGDNSATTVSGPRPTVTVSVPAEPGAEVTVTAPPVTVTKPAPAKTVTAPPVGPVSVMTEDGIYLVGTDIKPGQYKSGPGDGCYWARLSGTSGDFGDIITNHNGGNSVVTIRKTDKAFETSGCGEWKKVG